MRRLLLTAIIALPIVGCQPKQMPATQPIAEPATAEMTTGIREAYQQKDPSAVVGRVIAVLSEQSLAAVGDVPVDKFKDGDVVTFIDSNQAIIAVGTVVNITADAVHVKYTAQGEMARAPREGDLMVKTQS
ncbi:MAG TPA: hypothetical protein VFE58_07155 [Tepidisphaeraceae bacterium]|jgi:hypothetical protein|nr:hypothetical protein [Tepidisphaeraceae bacterium]